MRLLRWLVSLVFANFGFKVLSVAAAVAIWASVATEPELSTFVTAPVEYKNLPDDLEISSTPTASVLLEVQGPSGQLSVPPPLASVVIDMGNAVPGERTFTIDSGSLKLPRGVRLLRASPQQLRFVYEKVVTRDVPVRITTLNEGQQNYYIASSRATPDTLRITGPASHVAAIKEARTDVIDVAGVVSSKQFRTNAYLLDPLVKFVDSPQVDVQITMKKK
jgi:hypothetical protein